MNGIDSTGAPKGFHVTTLGDGCLAIDFHPPRTAWLGWTLLVIDMAWLVFWSLAGVFATYRSSNYGDPPWWFTVLWWLMGFGVLCLLGTFSWRLCAVTRFTFYNDHLLIQRMFFKIQIRRNISRRNIRVVRQVYDGRDWDESHEPAWGLLVQAPIPGRLLTGGERKWSAWLGPIVAKWAEVRYEPSDIQEEEGA